MYLARTLVKSYPRQPIHISIRTQNIWEPLRSGIYQVVFGTNSSKCRDIQWHLVGHSEKCWST